jgi:Integrase core domain
MPRHDDDGGPFFQHARTVIQQASFAVTQHPEERERIAGHFERVERLLTCFIRLENQQQPDYIIELGAWIITARELLSVLSQRLEAMDIFDYDLDINESSDDVIRAVIIPVFQEQSTGGRPKLLLDWPTILGYRDAGYTWHDIAELMCISSRTLQRHRRENNIQDPKPYAAITDIELDAVIRNITHQTAGVIGSQFMQSALLDQNLKIQRQRIRDSMARIDPVGTLDRWAAVIPRRVYSVAGPNSLWHMDGNLKLRKYGFVLHGAIDGYSRYIIYLEANMNNRAETVLEAFVRGIGTVQQVPSRLRTDKGSENRDVALFMVHERGKNRGSCITGRSVHNQRIERLWRDVNRWLISFHFIFAHLREELGIYDPDDPIDQFVLGFVYLPILRRTLAKFLRVWNNHKIRTEHYRTPAQLYITPHTTNVINSSALPTDEIQYQYYGVDWDGPVSRDPVDIQHGDGMDDNSAIVEAAPRPISDEMWEVLNQEYHATLGAIFRSAEHDWMLSNNNYGVELYSNIRLWVQSNLSSV